MFVRVRRSLGNPLTTWPLDGPDAALNVALNNLALGGMVVIAAAGNSGGLDISVSPPDTGLCVPAEHMLESDEALPACVTLHLADQRVGPAWPMAVFCQAVLREP